MIVWLTNGDNSNSIYFLIIKQFHKFQHVFNLKNLIVLLILILPNNLIPHNSSPSIQFSKFQQQSTQKQSQTSEDNNPTTITLQEIVFYGIDNTHILFTSILPFNTYYFQAKISPLQKFNINFPKQFSFTFQDSSKQCQQFSNVKCLCIMK